MARAPLLYKQAKTTVSWPQVYHWVVRKCHCSLCQNESQVIGTLATLQPSPCQNESFGVRTFHNSGAFKKRRIETKRKWGWNNVAGIKTGCAFSACKSTNKV